MAGIAGIVGSDNGELELMLERIKHRGPHEMWTNREQGVNIGCCELNVGGDVKPGSHYMSDGKRSAVLDGRVYNPEKQGRTDAEALMALYDRFGGTFARKIDGDFACAVTPDAGPRT